MEASITASGESPTMHLFKTDLFRSFAIGFGLGAIAVFATFGGWAGDSAGSAVVPHAVAAPAN